MEAGDGRHQWHHRNWYRTSTCARHNPYTRDCDQWKDTGNEVEPRPACATVPEWSATKPSGATCDLHRSWIEDGTKYDWERHRTEQTGAKPRCHLPGSGVQPPGRSADTSPPGGASVVYQNSNTKPSQYEGSKRHCGWWTSRGSHDHTTTTVAPPDPDPDPDPENPVWSRSCSYDFTVGTSVTQALPTYSDSRVSGYSYSGSTPTGMSISGSSSLTISGRPSSITGTLAVSRGTITASISGDDDATLSCVFRVRTEQTTVPPKPPTESGWSGPCYEQLDLGEYLGEKDTSGVYLPYYLGSDIDDRHWYSGRRPRGVFAGRGDGEAFLYGTVGQPGTFKGWINARVGRGRVRAPCVIYVNPGTWTPELCEFTLETGRAYDLAMPRVNLRDVDSYYSSGSLPPGLTRTGSRVKGVPTTAGTWSPRWVASIRDVSSRYRPSTTCTFTVVEGSPPPGWSGRCDWTFTVGTSYTRVLPVADGATVHRWSGDEPDGMRMRTIQTADGVSAQQLSGTPTSEGTWTGTLTPRNAEAGVEPIDCSFEVLPGPDIVECSRTIPSDQIDGVRNAVEWRTDVPRANAHSDLPGGDRYLITTGDPGVGGGSPRIWPVWSADDDLTVTDTTGCVWEMVEVISSAHPLFVWYDSDMDVIRRVASALETQWNAMTTDQRAEVEATARRTLTRVGLGQPEDNKWLGGSCQPGDAPESACVWGLPFPGVWQWAMTIRYRSPNDSQDRDLTIASGTTRFWRFADQVRPG